MALLVTTSLAGAGCSYFSTIDECSDLAGTINPVLGAIAREEDAAKRDPKLYRALGAKYAGIAQSLLHKEYRSTELSRLVGDYAALLQETANNALLFAMASESNDRKTQKVAVHTARQHVSKQKYFVRRFEAVCRGE